MLLTSSGMCITVFQSIKVVPFCDIIGPSSKYLCHFLDLSKSRVDKLVPESEYMYILPDLTLQMPLSDPLGQRYFTVYICISFMAMNDGFCDFPSIAQEKN